ncbi:MAG: hypothetical protein WD673_10160 [Alphaproteobacteria bacterium]
MRTLPTLLRFGADLYLVAGFAVSVSALALQLKSRGIDSGDPYIALALLSIACTVSAIWLMRLPSRIKSGRRRFDSPTELSATSNGAS